MSLKRELRLDGMETRRGEGTNRIPIGGAPVQPWETGEKHSEVLGKKGSSKGSHVARAKRGRVEMKRGGGDFE